MVPHSSGPATDSTGPIPGAGRALALLLAINLFNYIDRQVLSAVLPRLDMDTTLFDPADPWKGTKLGLLTTAFMVSYMLLSPLFGRLGDRMSRWLIVGLAVIVWSLASGSSGLASTYLILLLTRCIVGVGEAAYGPIAPAMLSDLYPPNQRGKIIALFYIAIPVGSALGFVIGGQVAEYFGDWRHSFYVTYAGVMLGLLCFFMREPPRANKLPGNGESENYFQVLRWLFRVPSFRYLTSGMTCTTFFLGGVATWVPVYIYQREGQFAVNDVMVGKLRALNQEQNAEIVAESVITKLNAAPLQNSITYPELFTHLQTVLTREEIQLYGNRIVEMAAAEGSVTVGHITFVFGAILVVTGILATVMGSWVGDRLRDRGVRGAYFQAAGWTTLMGWPCFLAVLYTPFPLAWVFVALTLFFLFFNTGPANTILANISTSAVRATCFAINILIIHALGDAISPTVIGFGRDILNLQTTLIITSFTILLGGTFWILGSRHLDEDTRRAVKADEAAAAQNPTAP